MFSHYEDMKGNAKWGYIVELRGFVWERHLNLSPVYGSGNFAAKIIFEKNEVQNL